MAYKPTRMDTIQRIINLHTEGFSIKRIGRTIGVSKNTVKKYLRRYNLEKEGLSKDSQDKSSVALLGIKHQQEIERDSRLQVKLSSIVKELKRVGVTRHLLWEEYKVKDPEGYSYSRFCKMVKSFKAQQDVTLRLDHKNGYTLTVDFAGKKLSWINRNTFEFHYNFNFKFLIQFRCFFQSQDYILIFDIS